jgi:hypothetical protein
LTQIFEKIFRSSSNTPKRRPKQQVGDRVLTPTPQRLGVSARTERSAVERKLRNSPKKLTVTLQLASPTAGRCES